MQVKVSGGLKEIIIQTSSSQAKFKSLFHESSLRLLKESKWVLSQSTQREANS